MPPEEDQNSPTGVLSVDALPDSIVENIFSNLGLGLGSAEAGVDSGQGEGGEPEPVSAPSPTAPPEPPQESEPGVPTPPGGPLEQEPADEPATQTGGATGDVPPAASAPTDPLVALLADRIQDPAIRDGVTRLLLGQAQPPEQPAPQQLPAFSEEDLENPAVRSLVLIAAEQQRQLQQFNQRLEETAQQAHQRQQAELANIANSAASRFQADYNLPAELMGAIRDEAGKHVYAAAQAVPNDPTTGQPDTYSVLTKALEIAYWASPQARQYEFNRQTEARTAAHERKQKLAGIGGNSGSAPNRNEPAVDPRTASEDERYAAMVSEVAAHMNGTDQQ